MLSGVPRLKGVERIITPECVHSVRFDPRAVAQTGREKIISINSRSFISPVTRLQHSLSFFLVAFIRPVWSSPYRLLYGVVACFISLDCGDRQTH